MIWILKHIKRKPLLSKNSNNLIAIYNATNNIKTTSYQTRNKEFPINSLDRHLLMLIPAYMRAV